MIIKINKKEQKDFDKICAELDLQVRFYTMESNPLIAQVEILNDGRELTPSMAYHVGRETGMQRMSSKIFK